MLRDAHQLTQASFRNLLRRDYSHGQLICMGILVFNFLQDHCPNGEPLRLPNLLPFSSSLCLPHFLPSPIPPSSSLLQSAQYLYFKGRIELMKGNINGVSYVCTACPYTTSFYLSREKVHRCTKLPNLCTAVDTTART